MEIQQWFGFAVAILIAVIPLLGTTLRFTRASRLRRTLKDSIALHESLPTQSKAARALAASIDLQVAELAVQKLVTVPFWSLFQFAALGALGYVLFFGAIIVQALSGEREEYQWIGFGGFILALIALGIFGAKWEQVKLLRQRQVRSIVAGRTSGSMKLEIRKNRVYFSLEQRFAKPDSVQQRHGVTRRR